MNEYAEHRNARDRGRMNLAIFEGLFGAIRTRLEDDVCGLVLGDETFGCFCGHGRFDDEELWEEHWCGPDFCGDLTEMFAAEELLAAMCGHGDYAQALAQVVCPNWESPEAKDEVLDFWYALAHALPVRRARAAAWVALESRRNC